METWTKIDEELHRLLDIVEPVRENLTKLEQAHQEYGTRMSSLEEAWKTIVARLDDLDRRLPVGNKVYIPAAGERGAPGRRNIERFIEDVVRMRFGEQPKHFDRKTFRYSVDGVARANQTEGTTTAGGFLVPEEILPEVVALIGEVGVARRLCRIIPMTRKDMKIPTRDTGPLVYWPGEGVKPTTSTVTVTRPELNSKTMMALDEVSEELDMDSIVPMAPMLTDLFVEAVALEEDKQVFSSTTPFTGVLQTPGVVDVTMASGKTAFTDLTYANLVDLKHAPDSKVVQRGTFVMHQDIIGIIQKLVDSTGQPIWRESQTTGLVAGPPGTILGRPYFTTNAMPDDSTSGASKYFIVYGDFRYWAFGDRMNMQIDISAEAGFTEFTKWMRVVERVAMKAIIPGAFARLKTAAA